MTTRKGFTLIELLVTVATIGILATAVVLVLNPPELLRQSRDSSRVASLSSLNKAVSTYYADALDNPASLSLGSTSITYFSIPDPTATTSAGTNCAGLGFPSGGYHCPAASNFG